MQGLRQHQLSILPHSHTHKHCWHYQNYITVTIS